MFEFYKMMTTYGKVGPSTQRRASVAPPALQRKVSFGPGKPVTQQAPPKQQVPVKKKTQVSDQWYATFKPKKFEV